VEVAEDQPPHHFHQELQHLVEVEVVVELFSLSFSYQLGHFPSLLVEEEPEEL
jgi:hypothetical protein